MSDRQFQHKPHVGSDYEKGLGGNKIMIMGYSHWSGDPDHAGFTTECIAKVRSGEWDDIDFFNQIVDYFGTDHDTLWSRCVFVNFLPRIVGDGDGRFEWGSKTGTEEGQQRAMALLDEYEPDMLFVFSRKAWSSLPQTLEKQDGGDLILPTETFDRHHYRTSNGHVVQAFGLRHTQGAKKEVMTEAVTAAQRMMAKPPV